MTQVRNCERCSTAFEPQRTWQRWCSSTCRVLANNIRPAYNSTRRRNYGAKYKRLRAIVLAESDVCGYCGRGGADTADHIIPVAYGGESTLDNLRPAHMRCNSAAGGRMSVHPSKGTTATSRLDLPKAKQGRWI